MAAAPSLPHELIAGHAAYYTISVIFAGVYLLLLKALKRAPSFWNGLLFGWVTMAFPFLVQMPLMGMGVLASATATPWPSLISPKSRCSVPTKLWLNRSASLRARASTWFGTSPRCTRR